MDTKDLVAVITVDVTLLFILGLIGIVAGEFLQSLFAWFLFILLPSIVGTVLGEYLFGEFRT